MQRDWIPACAGMTLSEAVAPIAVAPVAQATIRAKTVAFALENRAFLIN